MNNKKPIILMLLIASIVFFSSVLLSNIHQNSALRIVKILDKDSVQLLINEYCYLNKTIDSLDKIIKSNEPFNKTLEKVKVLKIDALQLVINQLQKKTSKIKGSKAIVFNHINYLLYVSHLDSERIQMHLLRPMHKSSLGNVKEFMESKKIKPLMITNAGMFTPTYEPKGLYIEENSVKKYGLDIGSPTSNVNFYLQPNGVFYINSKGIPHIDTTQEYARLQKIGKFKVMLATQSGPMLVINGRIHPAFTKVSINKKVRSGVGIIANKKIVFAVTLNESSFYDFAIFMRDIFGCNNALFLDGAISKMYLYDINPTELGGQFGPIISVSKKK